MGVILTLSSGIGFIYHSINLQQCWLKLIPFPVDKLEIEPVSPAWHISIVTFLSFAVSPPQQQICHHIIILFQVISTDCTLCTTTMIKLVVTIHILSANKRMVRMVSTWWIHIMIDIPMTCCYPIHIPYDLHTLHSILVEVYIARNYLPDYKLDPLHAVIHHDVTTYSMNSP